MRSAQSTAARKNGCTHSTLLVVFGSARRATRPTTGTARGTAVRGDILGRTPVRIARSSGVQSLHGHPWSPPACCPVVPTCTATLRPARPTCAWDLALHASQGLQLALGERASGLVIGVAAQFDAQSVESSCAGVHNKLVYVPIGEVGTPFNGP